MYKAGHIFRGCKPVHCSPSSHTVPAEAELKYPTGDTSKSIYRAKGYGGGSKVEGGHLEYYALTIPLNFAVVINPDLRYYVVDAHVSIVNGNTKLVLQVSTSLLNEKLL